MLIVVTGKPSAAMTQKAWRAVLLADPCAYCGEPSREVDHIRPKFGFGSDGTDHWTNLTGACRRCNRRKKSKTLLSVLHGTDAIGHNPEYRVRGIHYDKGYQRAA